MSILLASTGCNDLYEIDNKPFTKFFVHALNY